MRRINLAMQNDTCDTFSVNHRYARTRTRERSICKVVSHVSLAQDFGGSRAHTTYYMAQAGCRQKFNEAV